MITEYGVSRHRPKYLSTLSCKTNREVNKSVHTVVTCPVIIPLTRFLEFLCETEKAKCVKMQTSRVRYRSSEKSQN